MRTHRRTALLVAAAILAPVLGMPHSAAELPVTIPSALSGADSVPALTDVTVSNTGASDEVVFTFAGDIPPGVEATVANPPFRDTAGNVVTPAGAAFVNLRLAPARTVSLGESCEQAVDAPPSPGPGETGTTVFFSCFDGLNGPAPVVPSGRAVTAGSASQLLTATLEQLLAGPSAGDRAAGLTSLFSGATTGELASATVAADGTATVDFDPSLATTIPNASSSAGSDELVRELDATVFQFPGVTSATYELGGSCDDFYAWLQSDCTTRTRDDAEAARVATTYFGPDSVTGPSENVTEVVLIEDFEAQLTWVIGQDVAADVTVTTATDPARVIVDVPHAAPTPQPIPVQPSFTG